MKSQIKTHRNVHLKIYPDAICQNYQILSDKAPDAVCAAVVKADCYGLGMDHIAPRLYRAGCRVFFVAHAGEGQALRKILGRSADIYVFEGVTSDNASLFTKHRLYPVLNSPAQIDYFSQILRQNGKTHRCILHYDTGMNRLGLDISEREWLKTHATQLSVLDVDYIMTHAACADEIDNPMTRQQFENFITATKDMPEGIARDTNLSFCNSAGVFNNDEYHLDLIRPGMALYGLNPSPHTQNPMRPCISLAAPILQIRETRKGESIGYGATHIFKKPRRTATIGIGYADGLHRMLSNNGSVYIKGQRVPIIGRVSMDLISVDITDCERSPYEGEMVEIIGPHQSADDLANDAQTIGYEILTTLGKTLEKCYVEGDYPNTL